MSSRSRVSSTPDTDRVQKGICPTDNPLSSVQKNGAGEARGQGGRRRGPSERILSLPARNSATVLHQHSHYRMCACQEITQCPQLHLVHTIVNSHTIVDGPRLVNAHTAARPANTPLCNASRSNNDGKCRKTDLQSSEKGFFTVAL